MKLRTITEFKSEIVAIDPEDDWEMAGRAYQIAKESGVNISSNKEILLVALAGDEVIGGVWNAIVNDSDASGYYGEDINYYDFDVAVDKNFRGSRVGLELIDAALDHYNSLKSEGLVSYVRVWVINPKLARYLENHYGFDSDGGWSKNNPFMTYDR